MKVVSATMDDLKEWLMLASEVEYLFGSMVNDPKFIQALEKNINQDSAFCVRENDGLPGSRLLGGIYFQHQMPQNIKLVGYLFHRKREVKE
ncbi:hypothetical protein [Paenibacillus lentus]|uniref:GNAT family N-acetyltransferase n=1 Tax=Paenibacillus lentus TaxID=1338368 RepID=A0A3S8RQ68_9BACL|nr:hypothetical protein [Paenibacillus lentus]AZK44963.1 hypothetical protein EIM92_01105 [Paenibacillus lentus]